MSAERRHEAPDLEVRHALEQASSLHGLPARAPADARKPVAMLICHGMGQQVPFETLSAMADILRGCGTRPVPAVAVVRHVHFTNQTDARQSRWLPRAEILVPGPAGQPAREVHVYEAYWAPLTEGRISLSEVMWFLVTAGLRGLLPQTNYFKRWVFGQTHTYQRPMSTPLGLLATLLIIVALVIINALLTLVVGGNALSFLQSAKYGVLNRMLLFQLTTDLWWLLVLAAVAAVPLAWSALRRARALAALPPRLVTRGLPDALTWVGLGGLALGILLIAGTMSYHYLQLRKGGDGPLPPLLTLYPGAFMSAERYAALAKSVPWAVLLLVWGSVLGASFWARGFFVQYLGDVAIYIDSHKVDKFRDIREEIKRMAFETACTIYGAREPRPTADGADDEPAAFAYDRVVLAGHSLGSVITYDALNATLKLDDALGGQLRVAERTGSLITFGSPLDKITFLFDSQHPDDLLRVGLAASVQPLLSSLFARSAIHWVNIYSGNDIISGKLDFFELPDEDRDQPKEPKKDHDENPDPRDVRVENISDPQAVTPLQAHTQYWSNPLLAEQLQRSIFRPDALLG